MYWKLQIGFNIFSTIFKLVGSTNLEYDYFEIFKYIWIFECICEYFYKQYSYFYLWHNVSTIILFIFIFNYKKNYFLHSEVTILSQVTNVGGSPKKLLIPVNPLWMTGYKQSRSGWLRENWILGSFAAHLHIIQILT